MGGHNCHVRMGLGWNIGETAIFLHPTYVVYLVVRGLNQSSSREVYFSVTLLGDQVLFSVFIRTKSSI